MLRFDRRGEMLFAPLGGPTGLAVAAAHPEIADVDSLVLVDGPRPKTRSDAVLGLVRYLGGPWRVFSIGRLIPREIRDSLYDVIAYWRIRVFGGYVTCPIPPAEHRARFLA